MKRNSLRCSGDEPAHPALVADAELFRLEAIVRWLEQTDPMEVSQ